MTYHQTLAYLESLESLGIRPGLDRIRALLERLGNPQRSFASVLVGGTNGKGSVASYLASILREAGRPAGLYTSPHLVRFEERIHVAGQPIAPRDLVALTSEVAAASDGERRADGDAPTYFEATTAIAFLHFSRMGVPIAVLEVGMGGRFDATNVVTPLACAITAVAMDHTRYLGETLAEIAYQKAGILRAGVPAVIARQEPAALDVIRAEARAVGAPLIETTSCVAAPPPGRSRYPDPPAFSLCSPSGARYGDLAVRLHGDHQVENAAAAVLLAEHLATGRHPAPDPPAISRGLRRAVWPGRIELVPGDPGWLLDGAHNPAACRILANYLTDHQAGRPLVLVFAAMADKRFDAMLGILAPLMREVFVTTLPVRRAAPPDVLQRAALTQGCRATPCALPAEALRHARQAAGPGGLVVVSGSLYLVGEVKKMRGAD
jgi:dihydrofolate synthase/folylpolyglutamate synthase